MHTQQTYLAKAPRPVGVQVVHHQDHGPGVGVGVLDQLPEHLREVLGRPPLGHLHTPPEGR